MAIFGSLSPLTMEPSIRSFLLLLTFCFFLPRAQAQEKELEPTEDKALMTVTVVDGNEEPKAGQEVRFTAKETGKEYVGKSGEDGTFEILLPKGDKYTASYEVFGEEQRYQEIELPDQKGRMRFDFKLVFQMPEKITLRDVHFNTAEATLRESSYDALKDLEKALKDDPSLKVEIAGHTDSRGEPSENQELSEGRAQAVVDHLVENGIDSSRLVAKGYGERKPVASNETAEGRQKNRRTEVRILER